MFIYNMVFVIYEILFEFYWILKFKIVCLILFGIFCIFSLSINFVFIFGFICWILVIGE